MDRSLPSRLLEIPEVRLAGWGLLLNGAWELLQSPLYADHTRGPAYVLWTRLHCTAGDVMILLGAFWVASLVLGGRRWWRNTRVGAVLLFTLLGLGYTIWSEWLNTEVRRSWQYSAAMPQVLGLGLAPLLQWTLLPVCVLLLVRRSAPGGLRTSAGDRS